ncbi:DUF2291 family protein [Cohaesibacter celericrescens]|uniref:DUF2291 family protein n=1 Tax=Cohaesibacter celericrescens TaxID=2067669 RepID=UPI003562805D
MNNQTALRHAATLTAAIGIALSLSACKIVKNEPPRKKAEGELEIFFSDDKFNPDKIVADMWSDKLLPFADSAANDLGEVVGAYKSNAAEAGKKYGHREKEEGSPWNFIVKGTAKIVEVNTKSRASTLGLDLPPYDGNKDMLLQIGPVLKGSSIRDSLDFLKFDDFTNQLEYARISNAINKRVNADVLSGLDREALDGKEVSFTGMFTDDGASKPVLVTPVRLTVGDGG